MRLSLFSILFIFSLSIFAAGPRTISEDELFFQKNVQPILNGRCVACHSCYDSPCQFNLQSYSGAKRGATKEQVYHGSRLDAVTPTRLFEDAQAVSEWRKLGFYDVLGDDPTSSVFLKMVNPAWSTPKPTVKVEETKSCQKFVNRMPYALPALKDSEYTVLQDWIKRRPSSEIARIGLQDVLKKDIQVIREWENFLNDKEVRHRLVARYLFEHLFLAHFYTDLKSGNFFKLVRSKTACEKEIQPVSARRPNSDPGVSKWFYCFYKDTSVVMYKNHIPYELSTDKLKWIEHNFMAEEWSTKAFPSFDEKVAGNPFVTFQDIPPKIRYRFLLEDARYHIMTFIKGPVCSGSIAVNSIQEHFYTFFIDPDSDMIANHKEYARAVENLLILPGDFKANKDVLNIFSNYKILAKVRNDYRNLHNEHLKKYFPKGLGLKNIWNGDEKNHNAVLTIFRHNDNADVAWGPKGDLPKTAFMLDYSLFERYVYNLVVNFDVFGNVEHQTLTRLYMDLLRMESENNYLDFLPAKERLALKKKWYRGFITKIKLDLLNENQFSAVPSAITFHKSAANHHLELLQDIIFDRMSEAVRGRDDVINWKQLKKIKNIPSAEITDLRALASVPALDKTPFPRYFPEYSVLLVSRNGEPQKIYSIIHNREHQNISWMLFENLRLAPKEDTLTILPSLYGGYANQFFAVEESELKKFVATVLAVKNQKSFEQKLQPYVVDRTTPSFWSIYDNINKLTKQQNSLENGFIDLSRYQGL